MNTINKITEGNAFALNIRQAVWRTLGGVIQPLQASELVDVHLYVGSGSSKNTATEYPVTADGDTISAVMPATLKRGVYKTWLTAKYNGRMVSSNCEAAFEIVPFDEHYQAYAPERVDAPMAVYLQPADVTDAELEQLKAEFRAKNAALDAAKAEAEQARQEYIAKAEELESVATSEQVVAIGALTSEEIERVKELIGTPAEGQADTLFAAINASPVGIIADVEQGKKAISDAIVYRGGESSPTDAFSAIAESIRNIPLDGIVLAGTEWVDGFIPKTALDAVTNAQSKLKRYVNNDITSIDTDIFQRMESIEYIEMNSLILCKKSLFAYSKNLRVVKLNSVKSSDDVYFRFQDCIKLELVEMESLQRLVIDNLTDNCISLNEIRFPNLIHCQGAIFYAPNLVRIIIPKVSVLYTILERLPKLNEVELGTLTIMSNDFIKSDCTNLKKLTIGIGTNISLYLKSWGSSEIWNSNVDTEEFNTNFRSGIIERVYDRSGLDAPNTITLGQYAFAKLTEETIALANAKGWNIAQG